MMNAHDTVTSSVSTRSNTKHINLLIWNIQGIGNNETLNILREHIRQHRPHIVALVETRISGTRAQAVSTKIGFRNCFCVEAQGFQGGIWVFWNEDEIEVEVLTSHAQFVTVELKYPGYLGWVLTCVYASPQAQTREALWQILQTQAEGMRKPWLLAGDFNETKNIEERNHGGADIERRCRRFQNWIDNSGLVDLGFSGPKFTWARGRTPATRKEARLDRGLCNAAWRVHFPNGEVRHLIQAGSDHCPLLISTGGFVDSGRLNKPFRFQAAWTTHPQFEAVIQTNWSTSHHLVPKLHNLALALSCWNKASFGNLFQRKRKLWARIEGIQRRLAAGSSPHLLKLEQRLRQELDQTLDQLALLWIQRARVEQIRDGDRNTKYYHLSTVIRQRYNRVSALLDGENRWCSNTNTIKQMIVDHFRALFSEDDPAPTMDGLNGTAFPQIPADQLEILQTPFTNHDVLTALKGMQPLKAPGPDGFHALFFSRSWHIVGEDVCSTVLQVLRGEPMPRGLNDTFITLIPKVANPQCVTQFRPIGLCNVTYKLATKCIVNRLRQILPHLISPAQASFIPG